MNFPEKPREMGNWGIPNVGLILPLQLVSFYVRLAQGTSLGLLAKVASNRQVQLTMHREALSTYQGKTCQKAQRNPHTILLFSQKNSDFYTIDLIWRNFMQTQAKLWQIGSLRKEGMHSKSANI